MVLNTTLIDPLCTQANSLRACFLPNSRLIFSQIMFLPFSWRWSSTDNIIHSFVHQSFEVASVTLSYPHTSSVFYIYRPRLESTDAMFLTDLHALFDASNGRSIISIVFDDVNIQFDRPTNPTTANVTDILDIFDFSQLVDQSTHVQGHILDWVVYAPDDGVLSNTAGFGNLVI